MIKSFFYFLFRIYYFLTWRKIIDFKISVIKMSGIIMDNIDLSSINK